MANEAVCIEAPRIIKRYSVVNGTAIAKGTILKLSGADLYADASAADGDLFAGIAVEEKTASDTITNIGAAIDGVWDIKCNAGVGITLGGICSLSGANLIKQAEAGDLLNGAAFGKVLETAATNEVVRVRLGLI